MRHEFHSQYLFPGCAFHYHFVSLAVQMHIPQMRVKAFFQRQPEMQMS